MCTIRDNAYTSDIRHNSYLRVRNGFFARDFF
jgi:hypothetical protein